MKRKSWIQPYANAVIADMASKQSPEGSLAKKHTGEVALRYALETRSIWRWELFRKVILISGLIALALIVWSNLP